MNKQIYSFIIILLFFLSCSRENICLLSGSIDNCTNNTYLYLSDINSSDIIDSIKIVKGTFNYQIELDHPQLFVLHKKVFKNKFRDEKLIWLESSKINLSGDFNFMQNLKVKGSHSHEEYNRHNLEIKNLVKQINSVKDSLIIFCLSKNTKFIDEKIDMLPKSVINDNKFQTFKMKYDSLNNERVTKETLFLSSDTNSYVALNRLYEISYQTRDFASLNKRPLTKKQIKIIYDKFSNVLKNCPQGLKIKKYIELQRTLQVGDTAPDIMQKSPNEEIIKLSDLKGKYVMIEFWSSWCKPCRASFPDLIKIYTKYHPYGFEILGVSCDRQKSNWKTAIKHDSLPWLNIADMNGWENEAFLVYDIKYVPSNILIDKNGYIIGKDYSNSQLNKLLNAIFNK